jgi:hypothetical protein
VQHEWVGNGRVWLFAGQHAWAGSGLARSVAGEEEDRVGEKREIKENPLTGGS